MTWTGRVLLLQTGVWAAGAITAWLANTRPSRRPRCTEEPGSPQGRHPEHARPSLPTWPADPHPPGDSHARGWGWGCG